MWNWLINDLFGTLFDFIGLLIAFLFTNFTAIFGFVLALLIIARMINEKRNPSNFFAWSFVIIFFPFIGVPLYFLFGGRKSRRLARLKREVQTVVDRISTENADDSEVAATLSAINNQETSDQVGGAPFGGNRFELLSDGEQTFARLMREIERAERRICISTYILQNDVAGAPIVDLLCKRASEGLDVRVLVDALGSWNRTGAISRKLKASGGRLARFMPVLPIQTHSSANLRNHRKLALFDDRCAITGGQNIDTRFMGPSPTPDRFTDFSAYIEGPAVASFNRIFVSDWAFAAKTPPALDEDILTFVPPEAGTSTIETIASGPDVDGDPLWEQVVRMVQECRHHLTIVTPYFIPDEVLFQSLIVKAHTGRKIRLILPFESNHKIVDIARYHFLRKLNSAGVEILFYKPRMLHGKLILVDDNVAMMGSANIDMRSLFVNFEIGLFHYSKSDIEALTAWTENVIRDSVGFDASPRANVGHRSKLAEDFVHLLAPML